ncbi:pimeloyl-ACP methyl esterase BioG family protein [Aestuariispira ectoiniformans]|uniref:pimeloyl-ACP methyl esterase BioG family protein n=1 Tax=Aestuariispira ectoiniformans TaxID=2775080 RepID=UPI00223B7FFB|nr:pimeloyl-ACP methyl esterase BioG family protein [Aestuariispira ectoiniformans]
MQVGWLKQTADASGIIVIFGGWAVGSGVFSHLQGDQDLLFVDDYRTLDSDLPDLSAYSQRTAVAWSFGVAAFAHWLAGRPDIFNRKVAITGSLSPVDRRMGIPPVVFERTVKGLTEESYQGFLALCFGEAQPRQDIDVDARRAELEAVRDRGSAPDTQFDRIWISRNDRIFPAANLTRSWEAQADRVLTVDAPHVPFPLWHHWNEVLGVS